MNKSLPLAVLLAGCSFIPAYERPAAPVPQHWPTQGAVLSAPSFDGDWRAFFTDPALQRLIDWALEYNRDLRIAVGRVEEARALAGIAHSDRLPSLDIGVQEQAARVPGTLTNSGRATINRRYDANLGITAFELDFWGRLASLDAASRANFLASEFAAQAFRLALIGEVASAYYSLAELNERTLLAKATVQSRAESRELIARRREVGLASDLDFHAAEGAYQSAQAELSNLARQKAAAENALWLLTGQRGAASPAPTFGMLPEIDVGLPSEVLLRRPDVQAAEQRLIAANANIGAARAAFFPRIALTVA
ncbi:MAG: efflux transporter outer membrane subunit, partial [Rhodocyclaceae bacterium]